MRSDWWKFNESMTSGTRPPVRNIRRGEEGVRASDLGPSENQAILHGEHIKISGSADGIKTRIKIISARNVFCFQSGSQKENKNK